MCVKTLNDIHFETKEIEYYNINILLVPGTDAHVPHWDQLTPLLAFYFNQLYYSMILHFDPTLNCILTPT